MVNNYRYSISGKFVKKLTEARLKKIFQTLLGIKLFDGFSQADTKPQASGKAMSRVLVSSKNNELTLEVSPKGFEFTIENPEIANPYLKKWPEVAGYINEINSKTQIFEELEELDFGHIFFLVSKTRSDRMAKKFLAGPIAEDAFGFRVTAAYHRQDETLESGHYHEFFSVAVGYPVGQAESAFSDLVGDNTPYFFETHYRVDAGHEGDGVLAKEESLSFVQFRIELLESSRETLFKRVGLAVNGKKDT